MHSTHLPFFARFALLVWFAFYAPAVFAQATPNSEPSVDGRAVRDASNPMRMIIEASKLKPRKAELDLPVASDKRTMRARAAPAVVSQPPVAKAVESASAPAPAASNPSVVVEKQEAEPKLAAVPPAATLQATPPATPPSAAASKPEPLQALPVSPTPAFAASAAGIQLAAAKPVAAPAQPAPLKQVNMVAPELPGHVMRRLRGNVEIVVGFIVNTDGSVSNVAVRSSAMKALEEPVIEAVRQWRYEPIGEAREHAVQLLVRPGL